MDIQVLKVSGNSNLNAVSEAIIEHVLKNSIVHVDCIGIKASYVATKSLIQTTKYLVENGYKLNLRPYYVKVDTLTQECDITSKTAIRWTLVAKTR